jgi:hypothetical protein
MTAKSGKNFFSNMLDEIKEVNEKYGLPKGILLVPDRLEFSVKRNSYDNLTLHYEEYFDYLPDAVLDLVVPLTINALTQTGIPKNRIQRIAKNGVSIELEGRASVVVGAVLNELLIQKRYTEEDISRLINTIRRLQKSFSESMDFEFEWNTEIAEKYLGNLTKTSNIVMSNPDYLSEIQGIQKKYSESIERARARLEKKDSGT